MQSSSPHEPISRSWVDAATTWYEAGTHKKPLTRGTELRIVKYLSSRWQDKALHQIDDDAIRQIVKEQQATGIAPRMVNMYLEVIRAVLRSARKRRWIDSIPEIQLLRRPPRPVRFLTQTEADRLIRELPPHLKAIAAFSLETGLRKSNVLNLAWAQVDLQRSAAWINSNQAKAGKSIPVPLSARAVALLDQQRGKSPVWCFTYKGQRVNQCNTKAWGKALKRAGIVQFRWHDLRHTWASWHAQNGTPMHVLQALGGWSSPAMVQVYAHLAIEHLAAYVRAHEAKLNAARRQTGNGFGGR